MQPDDMLFHLNYAISLANAGRTIAAAEQWAIHNELYDAAARDEGATPRADDADVTTMRARLAATFAATTKAK